MGFVRIFFKLFLGLFGSDDDTSVGGDEEVRITAEGALRSSLDEFICVKQR